MFTDIIGHINVLKILNGILRTGNIAHAYLFYGPPSVGKHTVAQAFAKALVCRTPADDGAPCGECLLCRKAAKNVLTDIIELAPDGARIKIDQVRQLKKDLAFGPLEARYKVVIIDPADAMTTEAANSFLKLLEEPVSGVVHILVTSTISGLLPTIRSRCQQVPFNLLLSAEVARIMERTSPLKSEQAAAIAESAGGMLNEAMILTDPVTEEKVHILEAGHFNSMMTCVETSKKLLEDKASLKTILSIFLKRSFKKGRTDIASLTLETLSALRFNVNQSLLLETFLMKLNELRA